MMNLAESKEAFIRLVQIPSVTGSCQEEQACAFLEEILNSHGIETERIARIPYMKHEWMLQQHYGEV